MVESIQMKNSGKVFWVCGLLGLLNFVMCQPVFSQQLVPAVIYHGDTIASIDLKPFTVVSMRTFKDAYDQARFNQLKKNVYSVYPYAVEAAKIFVDVNTVLNSNISKKDKNKFLKIKENELHDKFAEPLKNLTTTQGAILVKLINRQTGQTVYDLLKDYKNGFSAFYWNNLGKLLGYDLKVDYDPTGADKDIEIIVQSIENNL